MLIVEFHCHTNASPDSLVRPADLVAACRARGLDRVVVTDHNQISGALKAQAIDPELVIVGEEVLTTKGELLAAFVSERVPSRLPPMEAIQRLRDQGAFVSVSHPFDPMRSGWDVEDLEELLPYVDAIETFNARSPLSLFNRRAAEFAARHAVLGTAGSDAHTLMELGRATMRLPAFHDSASLRVALQSATFDVQRSGLLVRLGSRWASVVNKLTGQQ